MIVSVDELIENIGDAEYQQYLIDSDLTIDELDAIHEYSLEIVQCNIKQSLSLSALWLFEFIGINLINKLIQNTIR